MRAVESILRGVAASALGTLGDGRVALPPLPARRRGRRLPGLEVLRRRPRLENAPGPSLVAKRFIEDVLGHDVSPRYARVLNNATHWGFGLATGAGYGLLLGSGRKPEMRYGPPFGAAVWASGYVVLPLLGVYQPIWKYDLETLGNDLSAHLVFGTATAAAFRLLAHGEVHQ